MDERLVSGASTFPSPPSRAEAEAAAWIARLQSDSCSEAVHAGLRAWLDADEGNREAFERATEVWELIPGAALMAEADPPFNAVQHGNDVRSAAERRPSRPRSVALLAACLVLFVSALVLIGQANRPQTFSVPVGEQRVATLDDGTRVSLNTGSDLSVDYREDVREVQLKGEAFFEVQHESDRPFVVIAGDERIVALGTSFVVRHLADSVSVTLIEGSVAISSTENGKHKPIVLDPGQRWSVSAAAPPRVDAPALAAATAWREGKTVFDDTTLAEATAEMNRYGGAQITLSDPGLASLRVSGAFNTREPVAFAHAVAALHGLQAVREGENVELRRDRNAAGM
ncbi:DUF4880 domain-containing protein [Pelagerythrobacter aerophilus]|uniref:DUF4880 domain-containing protein n=1 Tax=Pelagerythrobacter aerophilus TaxID=2306995 RepID=A0A418NG35_9SPHN|nr:DUF4880 domain-containing protein [Pelagerythrobacter aerophilus]